MEQENLTFSRAAASVFVASLLTLLFCHTSTAATDTPVSSATPPPSPIAAGTDPAPCFLVHYVSVQIPGGIRGLAPGTRVTVMTELGDRLRVKSDDLEFEIDKDHITHDPQIAMRASQVDTRTQQKLAESVVIQHQRIIETQQNQVTQLEQTRNGRSNVKELQERYRSLQKEEGEILLQIGQAEQRHPVRDSFGRHTIHYQPDQRAPQLPLLKSRLKDVQHEKNEARRQLEAAQRQR